MSKLAHTPTGGPRELRANVTLGDLQNAVKAYMDSEGREPQQNVLNDVLKKGDSNKFELDIEYTRSGKKVKKTVLADDYLRDETLGENSRFKEASIKGCFYSDTPADSTTFIKVDDLDVQDLILGARKKALETSIGEAFASEGVGRRAKINEAVRSALPGQIGIFTRVPAEAAAPPASRAEAGAGETAAPPASRAEAGAGETATPSASRAEAGGETATPPETSTLRYVETLDDRIRGGDLRIREGEVLAYRELYSPEEDFVRIEREDNGVVIAARKSAVDEIDAEAQAQAKGVKHRKVALWGGIAAATALGLAVLLPNVMHSKNKTHAPENKSKPQTELVVDQIAGGGVVKKPEAQVKAESLSDVLSRELANGAKERLERYRTANVGFFPETCRQEEIKLKEGGGDLYFGYESTSSPESKDRTKKAIEAIQYALDHKGQPKDGNPPPVYTGPEWVEILTGVPKEDGDRVTLSHLRTFEDMAKTKQPNADGVIAVPDQPRWTQLAPEIRRVHGLSTEDMSIQDADGTLRQIQTPEERIQQETQERIERNTKKLDGKYDEKINYEVKPGDERPVWVDRVKNEIIYLNDKGGEIHIKGVKLPKVGEERPAAPKAQ